MAYPYPPRHPSLSYTGEQHYFLTFSTNEGRGIFADGVAVDLVLTQILRTAGERAFEITAYCFMPNHVHLLVRGQSDRSDCREFIKSAKQYSGYYYKQAHGWQLWQRYGFERVVRDDLERAFVIGYIVGNPVRAGLVSHPAEFPYLGSQVHSVEELLEMCEYSSKWV